MPEKLLADVPLSALSAEEKNYVFVKTMPDAANLKGGEITTATHVAFRCCHTYPSGNISCAKCLQFKIIFFGNIKRVQKIVPKLGLSRTNEEHREHRIT